PRLAGKIDRIGVRGTNLVAINSTGKSSAPLRVAATNHRTAVEFLLKWLEQQACFASIAAVGHRVVHGMRHSAPERITPALLAELRRITPYDLDHLPREIELIEAFRER